MTNEEIERRAQELYDNIGPDFGQRIADALRAGALQAYEEAIKATCPFCRDGDPLDHDGPLLVHRYTSDAAGSRPARTLCKAQDIHELKASLEATPADESKVATRILPSY